MDRAPEVTIIIVHLNDPRLTAAIESSLRAAGPPRRVIVADGGSEPTTLKPIRDAFAQEPRVDILHLPGTVAATRARVLKFVRTPFVVFLDADQTAPEHWLDDLLGPLRKGADFSGGPTRPVLPDHDSGPARYLRQTETRLYQLVKDDTRYLPAGNSAWRTMSLRRAGGFDAAMGRSGEDFDLNLRAHRLGMRGVFVPSAWVWHDQSHLVTYRSILRRKYSYFVGGALAYARNGLLAQRARASAKRLVVHHWLDLSDLVLKPLALLKARRILDRQVRAAGSRSPRPETAT